MDLDLVTQLAIIAEEESAAIYHFTLLTLSALAVLLALLLVVTIAPKSHRKLSLWLFLAISAIVMIGAVQKPWKPRVVWPAGVTDNGSIIDTNAWATLEFKWNLREGYPKDTPLEFYCKPATGVGDWSAMGIEPAGSKYRLFHFGTVELPDNPTNYIYKVTSGYVPPELPSIALVSTTASNVTIKVNCATNYIGYSAQWEARRQQFKDTRLPVWGPWTDLGQAIIFNATETNRVVEGSFVNGRRNTEIRLKLHISEEATKGVRP